jgi:hypothetical protein
MSNALIIYTGELPKISIGSAFVALKDEALAGAALVAKVTCKAEQDVAVAAQVALKRASKTFEDARLEATAPFTKAARELKAIVDRERVDLDEEYLRLEKLNAEFIAIQNAKALAAEAAKNAELNRLERERQEALAKAETHEERDAINSAIDIKTAEAKEPLFVPTQRSPGQRVTEDWDIEVVDAHALYKAHWQCCELVPRLAEIKLLLNRGIVPPGVRAEKKLRAGVRLKQN